MSGVYQISWYGYEYRSPWQVSMFPRCIHANFWLYGYQKLSSRLFAAGAGTSSGHQQIGQRVFCVSESIRNDSKRHAGLTFALAAGMLAPIWLYTTLLVFSSVPAWPNSGFYNAVPPLAPAQSDRVFRATRLKPCTPLFGGYQPIHILRDLPGETIRGLGGKMTNKFNTNNHWSRGASAGAGAGRAYKGGSRSEALRQGRPWALRGLQKSESGARALRKYTFNAYAA
eukprot:5171367-Pleurochrysis_carterae.AAC.2